MAAIEVKSADADSVFGVHEFMRKYPQAKNYLIEGQGLSLDAAFSLSVGDVV